MQGPRNESWIRQLRDKKKVETQDFWPGWRGADRSGRVAFLPDRLPDKPIWRKLMPTPGLGGVAATDHVVIASGRDLDDTVDLWRCFDATTGETRWSVRQAAPGNLDYGRSPRATPLIHDGVAYCLGAFGHLLAIDITNGKVIWKRDSAIDFETPIKELPWGLCGSPLIVDGKLIYYAGGPDAALVALNPKNGNVIWKTSGHRPSYGSFIVATIHGVEQAIGYDDSTLGGWSVATGERLWSLKPDRPKDFNVPTPIVHAGQLVVTTENNRTRMYQFAQDGRIDPKPVATNELLKPDTHSPVVVGDRLFGIHKSLMCLDLSNHLQTIWSEDDHALKHYAAVVASRDRLLIINTNAEAILADVTADKFKVLDRRVLVDDEVGMYAHPAFAGSKMYLRASDAVYGFHLSDARK